MDAVGEGMPEAMFGGSSRVREGKGASSGTRALVVSCDSVCSGSSVFMGITSDGLLRLTCVDSSRIKKIIKR